VHIKYKSVSLIERNDKKYQLHLEHMRFIRNCNRSTRDQDYRRVITSWLETVLTKHLSKTFSLDCRNILSWEELNNRNQYFKKYREMDGLFTRGKEKIYVEIKASQSKSSFSKGKSQINETITLLNMAPDRIVAVLIMADCRCFDSTFGYALETIKEKIDASDAYRLINGLNSPTNFDGSQKWLWMLNQEDVLQLASMYGQPHEDDVDGEY